MEGAPRPPTWLPEWGDPLVLKMTIQARAGAAEDNMRETSQLPGSRQPEAVSKRPSS